MIPFQWEHWRTNAYPHRWQRRDWQIMWFHWLVSLLKTYVISCPANAALSLTKISSKTRMIESCPSDRRFPPVQGSIIYYQPKQMHKIQKGKPHQNDQMCIVSSSPQKNGNSYNKLQSTVTKHSNCSKAQRHSALPWWLVPLFRPIIMEESSRWSRVYPCHSSPNIDLVVSSRVWAG